MTYKSTTELPPGLKNNIPGEAQILYIETYNRALVKHQDESLARRLAWSSVKKVYEQSASGKWHKKYSER